MWKVEEGSGEDAHTSLLDGFARAHMQVQG